MLTIHSVGGTLADGHSSGYFGFMHLLFIFYTFWLSLSRILSAFLSVSQITEYVLDAFSLNLVRGYFSTV